MQRFVELKPRVNPINMTSKIVQWIEVQMRMEAASQHFGFRLVSRPLEKLYSFAIMVRDLLFRMGLIPVRSLPGFCISIGNLVVGGTGKSPLVISLCNHLIKQGHRPAVLIRGYMSGLQRGEFAVFLGGQCVDSSKGSELHADEARMISAHCEQVPVIVGSRRLRAADYFISKFGDRIQPTHWILDDGFQHRRIAREIDYVVVSSIQSFGNGCLLPRGILREPVKSLRRATKILLSNPSTDNKNRLKMELEKCGLASLGIEEVRLHGYQLNQITHLDTQTPLDKYRFAAVAGIANPERFFNDLNALGIEVHETETVRDHQRFDPELLKRMESKYTAVITTSKDYWRQPEVFKKLRIPCFVLEMNVDGALWHDLGNS
jgi:tetraacyldisaccharide 4'-kinase